MGASNNTTINYGQGKFEIDNDEKPIGNGASRIAYKATSTSEDWKAVVCVKIPKNGYYQYQINLQPEMSQLQKADDIIKQMVHEQKMEIDVRCANAVIGEVVDVKHYKLFGFIRFWNSTKFEKNRFVWVEELLEGRYEKWNSNSGYANVNYKFPQILSHYSWVKTRGRLLLCDLQGVRKNENKTKYIITDPAIHSIDKTYGSTDLGIVGMLLFFSNHLCTNECKQWPKIEVNSLESFHLINVHSQRSTFYMHNAGDVGLTNEQLNQIEEQYQEILSQIHF